MQLTIDGLTFIWQNTFGINKEIHVDPAISNLSNQQLYNAARKAEESVIGSLRGKIVNASGKESLTSNITKGVTVTLLDSWMIFAQANFTINDVVKEDGSSIFVPNPSITYQLILSVNSSIANVNSSGGSSITPSDIWSHPTRELSSTGNLKVWNVLLNSLTTSGSIGRGLMRLIKVNGLSNVSISASETSRISSDGDINQTITSNIDGSKTLSGSP